MVNRTDEEISQPGENENYAAGCLIADPKRWEEVPELDIEHFYSDRIRSILISIKRLRESGTPVDTGIIAEDLAYHGTLTNIGGLHYLNQLMESTPNIENFDYYAQKVIERHRRAGLRRKLEDCLESLCRGEDPQTALAELNGFTDQISNSRFEFLTAAELHNGNYDVEYFIPNIFVKHQPFALVGPQKGCKTNIASDLVISLATGSNFLGYFPVNGQYRVAFISCESGTGVLKENNERVAKSKGIDPSTITNLFYCFDVPSLDSQSDLAQLQHFIEQNKIDVLVIDPFYLTANLGNDAGNLFVVGEKLKPLTLLMQKTGCTIVLIHHTRKNTGQSETAEPRLEDIAYSGLPQWMRQWGLITRRMAYDPDNPGSNKLWFSAGGSAGHSKLFGLDIEEGVKSESETRLWNVNVIPAQEARAHSRESQDQKRDQKKEAQLQIDIKSITKCLRLKPKTKTKIRESTGITLARIEQALHFLIKEGAIETCKVMASNHQAYDGFKLTSSFSNSSVKTTETQHSSTHRKHPYRGFCE